MKHSLLFCLVIGSTTLVPGLAAQGAVNGSLSETALYSLYAKRHALTAELADLAATRGADGDVRRAAEKLARAHCEAEEKLEQAAAKRHLTLLAPTQDTSMVLLAQARTALGAKQGRSFDSTWVSLANSWLLTLILDNNRNVKPHIGSELQPIAREHTTWLFHQAADIDKLRKKFK